MNHWQSRCVWTAKSLSTLSTLSKRYDLGVWTENRLCPACPLCPLPCFVVFEAFSSVKFLGKRQTTSYGPGAPGPRRESFDGLLRKCPECIFNSSNLRAILSRATLRICA